MQCKKRSYLLAILVSLLVMGWGNQIWSEEDPTTNKDKVAIVNGTEISRTQFDNSLAYQKEIATMRGLTINDEQMPQLKYRVLENLVNTELLYQESRDSGIRIEEEEVAEAYEARKQQGRFETDAELAEVLEQSNKSITSYRNEIKQGLAVDRFIENKFTDNISVSDSEAKKYYDENPGYFQQPVQVRVSHILVRVPSNADQSQKDEAREKIEQVIKRLRTGDSFADLAKEFSDDTNSKDNGGDLGYISKGQVTQSFEDAAFALEKGKVSDIVETDSGYHIIKLTDKRAAKTISYEDAKSDIVNTLKKGKVNNAVNRLIIVLRNKSTIETFPVDK